MISNDTIDKIVKVLVDDAAPSRVILFGSYGRGQATEASDLDIMVIKQSVPERWAEMTRLRRRLRQFKIPVDIIVHDIPTWDEWRSIPGTLINTVAQEGRVVYEKQP